MFAFMNYLYEPPGCLDYFSGYKIGEEDVLLLPLDKL